MSRLCYVLLPVIAVLATSGCQRGNSPRLQDDPFIPKRTTTSGSKGNASYGLGGPFSRDKARGVSTSPVTDPLYASLPKTAESDHDDIGDHRSRLPVRGPLVDDSTPSPSGGGRVAIKTDKTLESDPFFGQSDLLLENQKSSATRFAGGISLEAAKRDVAARNDYRSIRRRLDRLGVRILWFGPEAGTDEVLFQGAIRHPNDPNRLRVFEARDPDGQRAMQAVTEAIEKWQESVGSMQ